MTQSTDDLPLNEHPIKLVRNGVEYEVIAVVGPRAMLTGTGRWLRGVVKLSWGVDVANHFTDFEMECLHYYLTEGDEIKGELTSDDENEEEIVTATWELVNPDRFKDDCLTGDQDSLPEVTGTVKEHLDKAFIGGFGDDPHVWLNIPAGSVVGSSIVELWKKARPLLAACDDVRSDLRAQVVKQCDIWFHS